MSSRTRIADYRRRAEQERNSDDLFAWRVWFYLVLGVGVVAVPGRVLGGILEDNPWARTAVVATVAAIALVDFVFRRRDD